LVLYRDLWDSKPPGLFVLYELAVRAVGAIHAAWLLDACVGAVTAILAARLAAALAGVGTKAAAAWVAGLAGAFVWSAPAFGGALVTGQAESCMAPLLLGAALLARRSGARHAFACGALLGLALTLKLVAAFALPVAWLYAPADRRRDLRRSAVLAFGIALPLTVAAIALAMHGVLQDAVRAVL